NDLIDGGDGDDWLDGGTGGDQIFGGAGTNDVVAYGASTSAVNADLQSFTFSGGDATGDTYSGIEGVSGSAFNDNLSGDANANRLLGQAGTDTLAGRGGNDFLQGGNDNDIFVFADNGGIDSVADFDDFGDDTIQLSITGITTFAQVQAVMTQSGADVLIDFANTDIILTSTTLASMGSDDFTFV
ncbi:MAG: calcium-binding protein, partial [Micropepsaceae bacterium]